MKNKNKKFCCTAGTEEPATRKTTNDKRQTATTTATKTTRTTTTEAEAEIQTAAATETIKIIRKIASMKP